MAVSIGNIFYFCTVKTLERHEVAAKMQRFLCPEFISKNIGRNEWGNSNIPKVFALKYLTARTAAFFYLFKTLEL